jgi:hypothetical protein
VGRSDSVSRRDGITVEQVLGVLFDSAASLGHLIGAPADHERPRAPPPRPQTAKLIPSSLASSGVRPNTDEIANIAESPRACA